MEICSYNHLLSHLVLGLNVKGLEKERAPLRGFTSDEDEEFLDHPHHLSHQDQPSTSRSHPYQPLPSTSRQDGHLRHQDQPSTSRSHPYQPFPSTSRHQDHPSTSTSRRVLHPRGPISSSRSIVESDSDALDKPGGPLRRRRILRHQIGLRIVRRPSMISSTHTNSDISVQPGPSGYVSPDMFHSDDPQEGPSNPHKRRCPNVSSSSDSE